MKYRIKVILPFIAVLFFYESGIAQNYGILGRKFLGKIVLVNGIQPFNLNVEGEYVFHENMSITAGLGLNTLNLEQNYYEENFSSPQQSRNPARVNSAFTNVQINFYPFNQLLTAPDGFYLSARGVVGLASMNSKAGFSLEVPQDYEIGSQVAPYRLGYLFYRKLETGMGVQKLIGKRWTIDFSAFYNMSTFNKNGNSESKQYTRTISKKYGPNVTSFTEYSNKNLTSGTPDESRGISFYVKIGYFIF